MERMSQLAGLICLLSRNWSEGGRIELNIYSQR